MKLHIDPETPTVIRDERNEPVMETGIQAGFSANVELAADMVARWNAAEELAHE